MSSRHAAFASLSFVTLHVAQAQTITPVVKRGDSIAGVGLVTTISHVAVNSSGVWLVDADTDAATTADEVVLRGGTLMLREGDALAPSPATLSSVDGFSINSAGNVGWNLFLDGMTPTTDSGVYFNTSLVIPESMLSIAPQFSPNTPYIGWFDARINDNDKILMLASVDDPAVASTVDRAIVIASTNGAGVLTSEAALIEEGDTIPGFGAETVADLATGPHTVAFSNSNMAIFKVDMTGPTATDGAIVVGSTIGLIVVAREGDPSPIAGRNYESLVTQSVDINDSGSWVAVADLDGSTANDSVIVENGTQIIAREGSAPPGISGFSLTSFGIGAVRIDNSNNVFWFGDWDDTDTTRDTGIFRNNQLIVQEGVTLVGGVPIEFISNLESNFSISPDGRYLIFKGRLQGGVDAAFLMDLGGPALTTFCFGDGTSTACPCGNAGTAGNGCASSVNPAGGHITASGFGSIANDTLVLTGTGVPNGPGLYFQGTVQVNGGAGVVFGDGLRCAGGTVVRLGNETATSGTSSYPGPGDPHVSVKGMVMSPGSRTYQLWYRNAGAFCTPSTFNLTNGIVITWGI
jgi:hypothetical protein